MNAAGWRLRASLCGGRVCVYARVVSESAACVVAACLCMLGWCREVPRVWCGGVVMASRSTNVRVVMRVPPETEAWLSDVALRTHMSKSAFLSAALVIGAKQLEMLARAGELAHDPAVVAAAERAAGGIPGVMPGLR